MRHSCRSALATALLCTPAGSLFAQLVPLPRPPPTLASPLPRTLPMTEFVVLVGGPEQDVFLPSTSWLIGMNQPSGDEGPPVPRE